MCICVHCLLPSGDTSGQETQSLLKQNEEKKRGSYMCTPIDKSSIKYIRTWREGDQRAGMRALVNEIIQGKSEK